MASIFQDHEVHLRDYLYILRKRRKVIMSFLILVIIAGGLFTAFEKVLYRATATILIEPENPNVVDFKEVMALDASTTDYYQTQYQMIKSASLAERLIEDKDLKKDPYLQKLQGGLSKKIFESVPGLGAFAAEESLADILIHKMIQVRPVRNSRLVAVSVFHPDPKRSAELTNRLVALFIQWSLENRFSINTQATGLISDQLVELKSKVTEAEKKLQDYKEEKELVSIPSMTEQNEFLQDAKLELVKIQAEASKLSKRYLPAHPKMISIRSQIEGLSEKITEEEEKILASSRVAIEYGQLEREMVSARRIYESLLSRLQETTSAAKTQASNIMVVDSAQIPSTPYKPQPILNMLLSFFIGFFGGVGLAFFTEYFNSTVKIPDDIEKGLGLNLFGIIPQQEKINKKDPVKGQLFFTPKTSSPVAESFRALRTALLFQLRHVSGCRTLLTTSPNPDDGKSTIALNLASVFQHNHLKILLMDGDLRKPKLHRLFDLDQENGLSEVLEGQFPVTQAIHENVGNLGFDFLSSGAFSHHPTEILGSQRMQELLMTLKKVYDVVLIDSAPYLAVADVDVLHEHVDGIVVVARYQKTERRHLKDLEKRFNGSGKKVLGVVMNQVSVREKDYYFQQYYYYGYGDVGKPR